MYNYTAKDGTRITNIPDEIDQNDPRLYEMYKQMKAAGVASAQYGSPVDPTGEAAMLGAAARQAPAPALPAAPAGRVQDLVMSEPRFDVKDLPTAMGTMGAVVRGAGPVAAGTLAGGLAAGLPGAVVGGASAGVAQFVGDPLISGINKLFGTNYTLPTDAIEDLFTRMGVAEPRNEAEKLIQAVSKGAAGGASDIMLGQALQMGAGLAPTTKQILDKWLSSGQLKGLVDGGSALERGAGVSLVPTTRALVGKAIESGHLQQILGGAGGAAGSTIAAQKGMGPLAQFGLGVLGSAGGSALGNAMSLQPAGVHPMQEAVDASGKLKTELRTSDVFPPETFLQKQVQKGMENIPFAGTGPGLAKQQKNRIADMRRLLNEYGSEYSASASDDVMRDMLAKRSGNIERWSGMKNKVIDELSFPKVADDGDTITSAAISVNGKIFEGPSHADAVQQATEKGLIKYTDRGYVDSDGDLLRPGWSDLFRTSKGKLINRFQADELFDTTASENMSRIVPMPATTKKIDDSIAMLKTLKNPTLWDPYIKELEAFKGSIDGQDLRNIEIARATIGDAFGASENDSVKRMGKKLVTGTKAEPGIYDAVNDDMGNYIKKAGSQKEFDKWKIANTELSKMIKELDLPILESTLENGKTRPEVVKSMIYSKDRSVLESLYKNLTANGRASAVTAIFQDVAKKVGDSPEKFVTEMKRLKNSGDPLGVFLRQDDIEAVKGLTRVLEASKRAGEFALNPPTGQQLYLPVGIATGAGVTGDLAKWFGGGVTGVALSAGAGVTALGLAGALSRAYESPAVRNILMKLPTVKPGSVEEGALFKRLLEAAQAVKPKEEVDER